MLVVALLAVLEWASAAGAKPSPTFAFLAPATLAENASQPHVAVDDKGGAVVVWIRSTSAGDVVEAALRRARGGWSTPTALSLPGGNSSPRVGVDAKGDAVVVWSREIGDTRVIEAASRPARGAWAPPTVLTTAEDWSYDPQVAVDDKGNAVAVWNRLTCCRAVVEAASRPADGSWSRPTALTTIDYLPEVQVAAGGKGDVVAVWQRDIAGGIGVEAASRPAGGAWSAPTVIGAAEGWSHTPHVAVDDRGDAVVVWYRNPVSGPSGPLVEAASRPARGAWSTPTVLSAVGGWWDGPAVATGDKGDAVAVWYRSTSSGDVVEGAWRRARGGWSTPTALSLPDGSSRNPRVGVDRKGDALAVWFRDTGSDLVVEAASRPARGGWSTSRALSLPDGNSYYPEVAVGDKGDAVAVWMRLSGDGWVLEAAVTD